MDKLQFSLKRLMLAVACLSVACAASGRLARSMDDRPSSHVWLLLGTIFVMTIIAGVILTGRIAIGLATLALLGAMVVGLFLLSLIQ